MASRPSQARGQRLRLQQPKSGVLRSETAFGIAASELYERQGNSFNPRQMGELPSLVSVEAGQFGVESNDRLDLVIQCFSPLKRGFAESRKGVLLVPGSWFVGLARGGYEQPRWGKTAQKSGPRGQS